MEEGENKENGMNKKKERAKKMEKAITTKITKKMESARK